MFAAMGAVGIAGTALLPLLGSEYEVTSAVALQADRESAMEWAHRAMFEVLGVSRVRVKGPSLIVDVPPEKSFGRVRSIGERVTVTIRDAELGTVAETRSQYRSPMRRDSGKNKENVDGLVAALVRMDSRTGPDPG